MDDVEYPGDAGFVDPAEPQGAGQDLLQHVVGQGPVRVDEGERHLPIQRGVQRLPELQGGCAAVEDQQPVAAAGDAGAGNQVLIVLVPRRFLARLAQRIEPGRIAGAESGRLEGGIRRRFAVGRRRGLRWRDGADLEVGWDVGLEIVGGR